MTAILGPQPKTGVKFNDAPDGGVQIVAELRSNHHGDRVRLERMIRAAKRAGANFVKLQKRDVASFYPPEDLGRDYLSPFGTTFEAFRTGLELDFEDFQFVDRLCQEIGIGWFASVLDELSFDFIAKFGPRIIKIPSTVSGNHNLIKSIADKHDGDVVVSTGMTDQSFVNWVVETFANAKRLYLLQCTSAYPTPPEDADIAVVASYAALAERYPFVVAGYSSHDVGWKGSVMAVAAGARMIEKHVTIGPRDDINDDPVALDLETMEFADFVSEIRDAERLLGSPVKAIRKSENHKYPRS